MIVFPSLVVVPVETGRSRGSSLGYDHRGVFLCAGSGNSVHYPVHGSGVQRVHGPVFCLSACYHGESLKLWWVCLCSHGFHGIAFTCIHVWRNFATMKVAMSISEACEVRLGGWMYFFLSRKFVLHPRPFFSASSWQTVSSDQNKVCGVHLSASLPGICHHGFQLGSLWQAYWWPPCPSEPFMVYGRVRGAPLHGSVYK